METRSVVVGYGRIASTPSRRATLASLAIFSSRNRPRFLRFKREVRLTRGHCFPEHRSLTCHSHDIVRTHLRTFPCIRPFSHQQIHHILRTSEGSDQDSGIRSRLVTSHAMKFRTGPTCLFDQRICDPQRIKKPFRGFLMM